MRRLARPFAQSFSALAQTLIYLTDHAREARQMLDP